MEIQKTKIPEVLLLKPKVFGDERGFFYESYHQARCKEGGLDIAFVQDNHSRSSQGVLRGMHYQKQHPQGKLVSVIRGKVFDVAVDCREHSPSFGQWVGEILSDENHHQLYVPPGFAHGFYVLSDIADFYYKCTEYYHPNDEVGIMWNDPAINIKWPLLGEPILSPKDQKYPLLKEIFERS